MNHLSLAKCATLGIQIMNNWILNHHCCSQKLMVEVPTHVEVAGMMHFLVEETVLGTLRQHDLQVEGHYVAIAVVDHHKDYFSVPPAAAHSTHVYDLSSSSCSI